MINSANTNNARGINVPTSNTSQFTNLQSTFNQLQSLPVSTSNTFSSEVVQNLIQLIQNLLRQLSNGSDRDSDSSDEESPTETNNSNIPLKKESSSGSMNDPDEQQEQESAVEISQTDNVEKLELRQGQLEDTSAPDITGQTGFIGIPAILGTEDDDKLNGTRDAEFIEGFAGNDRLSGRQGDDDLLGGEGNDRLHGGKGNDTLQGGTGNDLLFGGRGNDKLFGGEGNDDLYSRLGSDVLDGGNGNDTARIRGNFDDYSITTDSPQPGPADGAIGSIEGIVFFIKNEKTGHTVEATNIENYKFNDKQLSAFDLLKVATPNTPTTDNEQLVELSASQQSKLLGIFGLNQPGAVDAGVRVIDKDGSGTVSVGDTAVLSTGGAASVNQTFRDLSAEDVAAINNETQPEQNIVLLTAAQQQALQTITGITGDVIDADNSGTLTEGDYISQGDAGRLLTATEVEQILDFQPPYIDLTPTQTDAIKELTGFTDFRVDDNDLSNTLSEGDEVVSEVTSERVKLSAEDIVAINSTPTETKLDLSEDKQIAIRKLYDYSEEGNFIQTYTGTAIDKNNDGKLGIGDVVKVQKIDISTGNTEIIDHILTNYEDELINTPLTQKLSKEQNLNALALFSTTPGGGLQFNHVEYVDNDKDGKVSEGDEAVLFTQIIELAGELGTNIDGIKVNPESYLDGDNQKPGVVSKRTLTAADVASINTIK